MSALALGMTLPFASFGAAPPSPPTLAPVASVSSSIGSTTALVEWTASNKTFSAGFGYKVYLQINSDPEQLVYNEVGDTPLGTYYSNAGAAGETYSFRVVPFNDAGNGPTSNTASTILPGV